MERWVVPRDSLVFLLREGTSTEDSMPVALDTVP